jgi:hypothetical protein
VRNCLSNLQPFFPERTTLSEAAQLSMARGEEGKGLHIRQIGLTEAFTALWTVEGRDSLLEAVDRLSIATLGPVGGTKEEVRQGIYDGVPHGCRKRARWAEAMAWSYEPKLRKYTDRKPEICPNRR